jgi:curved DNA-binding protein CbpA
MPQRTLYEVLMVSQVADQEFITNAYRYLAKRHHPDHDPSPGAGARMAELNEAHSILSDPRQRAKYDEMLKASTEPRPAASAPGAVNLRYSDGGWSVRSAADRPPEDTQFGEAGPPPAMVPAKGSILSFGRYKGWSIGQVQRYDPDYLAWLARTPAGRTYRTELEAVLRQAV